MKKTNKCWILLLSSACCFTSCHTDDPIIRKEIIELPSQTPTSVDDFYILNESNMSSNKASLDYYDYKSGSYKRNIYSQANPEATLGVGDVGNDITVYGGKIYAVINNSNKIEVMDVKTTKRLKVIDVKIGRYVTFGNGKIYVSSYDGEIALGTSSPNGFVAEIDTTSLSITRSVKVGRQPEQLAVVGRNYISLIPEDIVHLIMKELFL